MVTEIYCTILIKSVVADQGQWRSASLRHPWMMAGRPACICSRIATALRLFVPEFQFEVKRFEVLASLARGGMGCQAA